ncbi:PAS domain S-box protein [Halorubellus sp. JP-L1]|uniref:PAS domain S-box protein n=1 Tax=Halorubellus sp. JP-L1 TaxID=2715753 RepID=UPI00140C8E59|nr:PAS domain S-box protein [Halorubellus sp. JP-L1]NHN43289.1 PAS domain S-box protein [Halorubellus sp. JP-L1]
MGRQSLSIDLLETLRTFEESGVPLTTPEVAESMDLGRRTVYARLERLVEEGRLETKKVGASARVWWRPATRGESEASDWARLANSLVDDVLNDVEVGIFVLDEALDVAWVNETTERYFGLHPEEVLGRDKRRLVEERIGSVVEDTETFTDTVLESYEDNMSPERFECHVTAGEGRDERWLEHRSTPIESGEYAGGRVELYYDVTERKREERTHREFESLVEAVDEYAIFTLDTDGTVRTWNPGAERIKGFDAEEIVGQHFSRFYTDVDRAAGVPEANLAAAEAEGSVEDVGWRVRADGSRFWANVTITAIRDDDGDLQGFAKVTRDMTDRREYERELEEEKSFVESLLENQRDVIYAFDDDGEILRWNEHFRNVTGYTDVEMDEMTPTDFVPEADADRVASAIELVANGESVTFEAPLLTADGETIPYEFSATPLTDEDGSVVGFTGIGRDVSERRAKERRLRRRREELKEELDDVFRRVDDAFFAVDDDWEFVDVNDQAKVVLGREGERLVGETLWEAFPGAIDSTFYEEYHRAFETQESMTFEEYFEPLEAWFEVNAYPSETGLSVYFRDVTERRERERDLERYKSIVETVDDGIYAVDEAGEFTLVNGAYLSMTGYSEETIVGSHVSSVVDEETYEAASALESELRSGERSTATLERELTTPNGETWVGEATFSLLPTDDGYERIGVVRDVTERKRRERELEESRRQYQTFIENFPNGAVALVDEDLRYASFGGTLEGDYDVPRSELIGGFIEEALPEAVADVVVPRYEAALDGEPASFEETVDGRTYQFQFVPVRDDDGETFAAMAMSQDVTGQKARERELEWRMHQQAAVAELGQRALEYGDVDDLLADATELVADVLGVDYSKVLDLAPDQRSLSLRSGVGWDEGLVGDASVSAVEDESQAAHTLATEQPVVVEDLDAHDAISGPELLTNHGVESGISTVIGPCNDPWGVLGAHATEKREFAGHDVTFLQSVASIIANAIDRAAHEDELVRRREELGALNTLHGVVEDVTSAVIEQSTREEIETTVCERLAATDSYAFAWIGDANPASETVDVRAQSADSDYLDGLTVSVDPDDERSDGPMGRAFLTGDVQVTQEITDDPRHEPWRDAGRDAGFRSAAAIPIFHDDMTYGVIGVYSDRAFAFGEREREVLGRLGEIVGHAIAAAERKRALMSDELVELEFQLRDVLETMDVSADGDGRIAIEHTVPTGDNEFVVFGTVTPDMVGALAELTEALPHWRDLSVDEDSDPRGFEVTLTEPPVLSVVASLGGYVQSAIIEDGDYHMTIHLAPSVDVREVIDAVEAEYPTATMLRQTHIERSREDIQRLGGPLLSELTDRQRTALAAAYHSGYFEWPRDATGEDVAASLDVAAPTFHQHLRKGEQKVFESLFDSSTEPEVMQ